MADDEIIATLDPGEYRILFMLLVLLYVETLRELPFVLQEIARTVTSAATRRAVREYCAALVPEGSALTDRYQIRKPRTTLAEHVFDHGQGVLERGI